ncbi:hypothetical protein ACJRO7_002456 [Eucalyptus globulus]|uniref:VQ domain-containing protein n=1 Tax=Eucalyptus globulus TaxID=34317 RepID=A0ABD3LXU0_EUCGL
MEEMVFRQEAYTPNPSPSRVAMHKHSRAISKANGKPKVRIVHIFAPEIIKTDVENFRELVQRLTGKPSERDRAKNKPRRIARGVDPTTTTTTTEEYWPPIATGVGWDAEDREEEARGRDGDSEQGARMTMEEEMRRDESYGSGGIGGELFGRRYEEFGGCYEEEFPLLGVDVSHMHAFEAAQLA